MPQMAPMNWLMLFFMFCLTLMMFNSMSYFTFKYPIKKILIKSNNLKINWKW